MRHIMILSACIFSVSVLTPPAGAEDRDKKNRDKRRQDSEKVVRPEPSLAERIEQLLQVLKGERKDDRRAKAAEELGKLASREHPEIVSALIDALVRDDSSSVRKAVVKALADIEPPSHEVKDALDQAVKQDKSWTVRQTARLAAWRYKPKDEPPHVPGTRLRNTSKPTARGQLTATPKTKTKPESATDPLKAALPPLPVLPVVPAKNPPAPPLAPAPSSQSNEPARLSAPRPNG